MFALSDKVNIEQMMEEKPLVFYAFHVGLYKLVNFEKNLIPI
jgi:hypothetical protein